MPRCACLLCLRTQQKLDSIPQLPRKQPGGAKTAAVEEACLTLKLWRMFKVMSATMSLSKLWKSQRRDRLLFYHILSIVFIYTLSYLKKKTISISFLFCFLWLDLSFLRIPTWAESLEWLCSRLLLKALLSLDLLWCFGPGCQSLSTLWVGLGVQGQSVTTYTVDYQTSRCPWVTAFLYPEPACVFILQWLTTTRRVCWD